jgi:hypothetical protein
MRRRYFVTCGIVLLTIGPVIGLAQIKTQASLDAEQPAPTAQETLAPPTQAPAETTAESAAAQPASLVYIGPEGGFLLHPGKSRGIFRWSGTYWANSISFALEDANYWVYRLDGTNGWFAFGKNASGGTFVVWKGLTGNNNQIVWQDMPNGWMRASRGAASGNMN